jgi:NAD(P)H dehydrogenase (quinone)
MSGALFVTGASGQLGRRVLDLLLEAKPGPLVAGTRTPERLADFAARGVTVRKADFEDPQSLAGAFAGVERMLLISTDAIMVPGKRLKQHLNAVEAAAKAGIKHVVYTSMPNPDPDSPIPFAPDHRGTEQALSASSMSWTVLRNNWYMDMLLVSLPPAIASGQLFSAAGNGGAPYVTRQDCARAAAAALASTDTSKKVLNITGPAVITPADRARIASEITGRKVTYVPIDPEASKAGMIKAGTPEFFAGLTVATDLAIARGKMGPATTAVLDLTGRAPMSVAEFLTANRDALLGTAKGAGN